MPKQLMTMPSASRAPGRRSGATFAWRAMLPKEHGVLAWVSFPLGLAIALALSGAAILGGLAAFAGLGAAEAFGKALGPSPGRGKPGAAAACAVATAVSAVLAVGALLVAPRPGVLAVTFAASGLAGFGTLYLLRGRAPRRVGAEAAAIAGFVALGAGIAVGSGAAPLRVVAASVALFAWLILGLGYVKGQLATVLSKREPWRSALPWSALAVAVSVVVGIITGHLVIGLLPLAYPARVLTAIPPTSARDAKRVGLMELAWGVAFVVVVGFL